MLRVESYSHNASSFNFDVFYSDTVFRFTSVKLAH